MKRIECIGPAGVGKSTLLKAMAHARSRPAEWLTVEEANFAIANNILKSKNQKEQYILKAGFRLPLITSSVIRSTLKKEYVNSVYERKNEFEAIISYLLSLKLDDSLKGLYRYRWLLSRVEEAALLENYLPTNTVILDESVIHKIVNLILCINSSDIESFGRNIFDKCPVPHGIIHLTSEQHIIFKRLKNREAGKENWMLGFRGLDDDALYFQIENAIALNNCCTITMKEKGVPVLQLSATMKLKEQLALANAFIDSII